ncbi:hypothetical protein PORCRE_363 [Porphyromonas crevioricanis JCM 15906]|uniref:Uncharacterized protein n=1 Tax=Porphyromonas crevioricanis JCM 15906 TaxID=1305617 RepID=T1CG75_9PORP|nr:hypothetical protein PORCRE_363 [Porphyromonas crevioricanis JCM 15906]
MRQKGEEKHSQKALNLIGNTLYERKLKCVNINKIIHNLEP